MNLTLEKHLQNLFLTKKINYNIKFFQNFFYYAFNTIINMFFTIIYI